MAEFLDAAETSIDTVVFCTYSEDDCRVYLERLAHFIPEPASDVDEKQAGLSSDEVGQEASGTASQTAESNQRDEAASDATDAPSENKAWYFGGYRSPSWGAIYDNSGNATYAPSNVSDTLIVLDMTTQQEEVWTNKTLPPGTPSRAGPSTVWVPVGEQGILVVLGGVTYPSFANSNGDSANVAQNVSPI